MEHLFPIIGEGMWTLNLTSAAMTLIAMLVVLIMARLAVVNMSIRNPRGLQNLFEWLADFITGLAKDTIGGKRAMTYVPLAMTLITYLFISNQMGLIFNVNVEMEHGMVGISQEALAEHGGHAVVAFFASPTANMSVALAMSIGIVTMTHIIGLRNPRSYFKHYVEPYPALLPLHLIDEVSKFVTLGLRLFGNIFAGEVLVGIILGIPMAGGWFPTGGIPLVVWLAYSLFVGTIQSFVFTVLTLVYIGQKVPHDEHH
ncbi:F0F1 ATP synthase subunit A [Tumebacillus permanentifrigoris]|uniref:ATP synthase subunit a n=1 Tax=Tumebacillus permanentifrigoris TaxID=378543 RepID=A0A316E0E0_9BACL|nr:F0F1 ATP synthase subunit A [Tumebacillus permanentifrigoris]PWK16270.1 F-type H+-transporting ATPase subunit a [Tumebacillus permanentifrigoris]